MKNIANLPLILIPILCLTACSASPKNDGDNAPCTISKCENGVASQCDGSKELDCASAGGYCDTFSRGTSTYEWCACASTDVITCSGTGYIACTNGELRPRTCPKGMTCSGDAASPCECDNQADGTCPNDCTSDPDCTTCASVCLANSCGQASTSCNCGDCTSPKVCNNTTHLCENVTSDQLCSDTCTGGNSSWASDGSCDDDGPGADFAGCDYGTDCTDCGPRDPGGCVPACEGKCGGRDGCGDDCPNTCTSGEVCNEDFVCEPGTSEPTDNCDFAECGDTSSGESCGTCGAETTCVALSSIVDYRISGRRVRSCRDESFFGIPGIGDPSLPNDGSTITGESTDEGTIFAAADALGAPTSATAHVEEVTGEQFLYINAFNANHWEIHMRVPNWLARESMVRDTRTSSSTLVVNDIQNFSLTFSGAATTALHGEWNAVTSTAFPELCAIEIGRYDEGLTHTWGLDVEGRCRVRRSGSAVEKNVYFRGYISGFSFIPSGLD